MQKNQEIILASLLEKATAAGASAADALYMDNTELSVSQRLGKPEEMERAESSAIGLRVFVGNKIAMTSTTDVSETTLQETAERAVAMAKFSFDDPYSRLATQAELATTLPDLDLYDDAEPGIEWMREQCALAEDTARAMQGITNSEGAEMGVARHHITIATTAGFVRQYSTSSASLSACVLAGEGDKMERDYAYSIARHHQDLRDAKAIGQEAAERTLKRLNPTQPATKKMPVVFEPRVGRSLLSYLASAISGSAIARGTSFLQDKLHELLFHNSIQIIDDPHRIRGLGSKPCDGEGLANPMLEIVKDGVLCHWLLDLRSAAHLNLQSNGRASRGLGSSPSPSATNMYLAAGKQSPEQLIGDISYGLYVTDAFGMGVNLVTGDYSQGANGYLIEQGKLTKPVSELTIAGDLLSMFSGLTPANDLRFEHAMNVPTLRIESLMVAGS